MGELDLRLLAYLVGLPFALYALFRVWRSSSERVGKWVWTVFLLAAPIGGFLVWLFIGPGRAADAADNPSTGR